MYSGEKFCSPVYTHLEVDHDNPLFLFKLQKRNLVKALTLSCKLRNNFGEIPESSEKSGLL